MSTPEIWADLVSWLNTFAPETAKTIRAPAPEHLIRSFGHSLEQTAPGGWPGGLSALYRLFDGTERSTAAYIFPGYRPLSLEEAEKTRRMMLGIWAQVGAQMNAEFEREKSSSLYQNLRAAHQAHSSIPLPELHKPYDPEAAEAGAAGTRTFMFISPFLPIAEDGSGDFLFVDLRSGRQQGCVGEYFKEEADWRPAVWASVDALLEDTLSSLQSGRPSLSFRPVVVGGALTWDYTGRG